MVPTPEEVEARTRSLSEYDAFKGWMDEVNAAMDDIAGVTSDDIEDYAYRDAYDDDLSARSAAKRALRNAGFYG